VKPQDAASLLIYRHEGPRIDVLLGRRPGNSSFMPDVYVFPGGGVEAGDARVTPCHPLDTRIAGRLAVAGSQRKATQLALAAIRETWEETGLIIGHTTKRKQTFPQNWQGFADHCCCPDTSVLHYLGRAITPTSRPKRFHARFFACAVADIPGLADQSLIGNGELLDLHWCDARQTDDLPMRAVTRFMLEQLIAQLETGQSDWIGNTVFSRRNGQLRIWHDS